MPKNNVNYDFIIDELAKDPDFLDLSPNEQDSLVEELAQERFGTVRNSEGLMEKALNIIGTNIPIPGIGINNPIANERGEALGNFADSFSKGFTDVYTLGATKFARDAGKGIADIIPGISNPESRSFADSQQEIKNPLAFGIGAALPTARGAQQLFKGGVDFMFPREAAKKALPKASKDLSASIQEVFKRSKGNPKLGVPKADVLKKLEDGLSNSKVPSGQQGALFKKWIKKLKNSPDNILDANTIEEIETSFGHAARFGRESGANPRLVQASKDINRYASKLFDDIAAKSGVGEFSKRTAEKSRLLAKAKSPVPLRSKLAKRVFEGAALGSGGKIAFDFIKSIKD